VREGIRLTLTSGISLDLWSGTFVIEEAYLLFYIDECGIEQEANLVTFSFLLSDVESLERIAIYVGESVED
jgi:hypothetical protein